VDTVQRLERHEAVEVALASQVDKTHATAAELREDLVAADGSDRGWLL
jgi:hypothetical protein